LGPKVNKLKDEIATLERQIGRANASLDVTNNIEREMKRLARDKSWTSFNYQFFNSRRGRMRGLSNPNRLT